MNKGMNDSKTSLDKGVLVSQGLFFAIVFGYFYFVANYVLYFQETQSLFIFSVEYLRQNLSKPGGPLAYGAEFLTQFYAGKLLGSLIVSVILTLPGIILYFIKGRLFPDISVSWLLLLIPSCLLFLMQANYYHMMEYNLGFLLILLYYLFSFSSGKTTRRILVLILFPLVYYLAGAYVMIFAGMFVFHVLLLDEGKRKYIYAPLLLTIYVGSFLVFWKIVFLQSVRHIILFPLPPLDNAAHITTFFILTGYMVSFPLLCREVLQLFSSKWNNRVLSLMSKVVLLAIAIFFLFMEYDPRTARLVELERLIYAEEWEEAIESQEKSPSRDRIGQYFYNIALSETDQLCDRLFYGVQDFGPNSLVLPWAFEHLNSGGYFYYAIGLVSEAHRWAYEEMVVHGYRPQNIKILAKTSLINGDVRMARKYINILKRTVYYRDWAKDFEEMADNPDLMRSDPDLVRVLDILPRSNFFIEYNQAESNLPLLLEAQPDNKRAFEYFLAGLLLAKNVEVAVNFIKEMKEAGYTRIPRHLEEAALVYINSTNVFPDLGGLTISSETQARFDQYSAYYVQARADLSTLREKMQAEFGNTFWFYFQFG